MIFSGLRTRRIAMMIATALATFSIHTADAQVLGPVSPVPASTAISDVSRMAFQMAAEGRLGDVFRQVRGLASEAPNANPGLATLSRDIEQYQTNQQQQEQRQLTEYQKKLEELHKNIDDGKLRDALTSAVEAHDLALDRQKLLNDPKVVELVTRAEAEAAAHEENAQWLKALALYRGLELLYENQRKYTDHLKRVGRHVALLRLYAPEQLFEQYKKEAAELGDPEPEPWNFEDDRWERKLRGIEMPMLTEALALGAHRHVERNHSFEDQIIGGIDAVKDLFETDGLEKTFPTLADKDKATKFVDYLDTVRLSLAKRETPMGRSEAINVLARLQQQNLATVNLPEAVFVHELGDGAMDQLDQFSVFIWPHEVERFERTTKGKFTGVGIQITLIDRQLTVVTPLEGTPAHAAGIKPGDQIVTIDGKSTVGIDLESAVDKITGPEDTKVTLGVKTPGKDKARDVPLIRKSIHITSVKGWRRKADDNGKWDFYIDPALKIGYLRMTTFGPDTADELDAAVQSMIDDHGINGLIFDLRFNPGGRLDAAVGVSNRFLNSGTIVSTTQQLLTGRPWSAQADATHTFDDFPVIVLINKGSASASEIVSGALQDHKRALLVGERSYGKGSVQNLFRLGDDNAYLKLTTQYYKLPHGQIIHHRPDAKDWGVHPDVPVHMTDQQVADLLEARLVLDVLRADGDHFDPNAILRNRNNDEEGDDVDKKAEGDADKLPPVKSPDEILSRGLDPQLDTALLLLKTRLLGDPRS